MAGSGEPSNATLVATLAFSMGVMSLDQGSVGYLLPFIQPELRLSNTEVGLIASIYWVAFAVASYVTGNIADSRNDAKSYLVGALLAFGVGAIFSFFVRDLQTLMVARAMMGVIAGVIFTLGQSLLGMLSPPNRLSTNMGLVTAVGGSLSILIIAPAVLVQTASTFGWRAGYLALVLPALIAAGLIRRNILSFGHNESGVIQKQGTGSRSLFREMVELFRHRNIVVCAVLSSLCVAYISLAFTFLPTYFVAARRVSLSQMSAWMAVLGLSSILFAASLPPISDRVGRKPVLIVAFGSSILAPLAARYFDGPPPVLAVLLFLGWSMSGTGSFPMGIIPAETVQGKTLTRAVGLVIAIGVLFGGLAGPLIAGWCADRWGIGAPLLVQAACAALATLVAMALQETAPRRGTAMAIPNA